MKNFTMFILGFILLLCPFIFIRFHFKNEQEWSLVLYIFIYILSMLLLYIGYLLLRKIKITFSEILFLVCIILLFATSCNTYTGVRVGGCGAAWHPKKFNK